MHNAATTEGMHTLASTAAGPSIPVSAEFAAVRRDWTCRLPLLLCSPTQSLSPFYANWVFITLAHLRTTDYLLIPHKEIDHFIMQAGNAYHSGVCIERTCISSYGREVDKLLTTSLKQRGWKPVRVPPTLAAGLFWGMISRRSLFVAPQALCSLLLCRIPSDSGKNAHSWDD